MERVEAAGLFRGVGARDVERAAARAVEGGGVVLRDGVEGLLGRVLGSGGGGGGAVCVVSVAWSRRFVRGVLEGWARREGWGGGGGGWVVGGVEVRANEIEGGGLDRVFGAAGGIWTAGDKVRVMRDVVEAAAAGDGGGDESESRTIYIGDSTTDLACLLEADVGICIRDEAMTGEQRELQGTLKRVGVECLHVGRFRDGDVEDGGKRLWWARDFEEVCRSGVTDELSEVMAV